MNFVPSTGVPAWIAPRPLYSQALAAGLEYFSIIWVNDQDSVFFNWSKTSLLVNELAVKWAKQNIEKWKINNPQLWGHLRNADHWLENLNTNSERLGCTWSHCLWRWIINHQRWSVSALWHWLWWVLQSLTHQAQSKSSFIHWGVRSHGPELSWQQKLLKKLFTVYKSIFSLWQ